MNARRSLPLNPKRTKAQSPSRNDWASSQQKKVWQSIGLCFFCHLPLEALQPGGEHPRHEGSEIGYGLCDAAIRATIKRTLDYNGHLGATRTAE